MIWWLFFGITGECVDMGECKHIYGYEAGGCGEDSSLVYEYKPKEWWSCVNERFAFCPLCGQRLVNEQ